MATNPPVKVNKYYLYEDATKKVFYGDRYPQNRVDLIYLGTSDNPFPKMAAAVFLQEGKIEEGFTLLPLES